MPALDEGTPMFVQIAEQLADDIVADVLAEGARAPSTNELVADRGGRWAGSRGNFALVRSSSPARKQSIFPTMRTGVSDDDESRLLA